MIRRLFICLIAAACSASRPHYPLTEKPRPFSGYDANQAHAAPDVASTVTFDRLRNARKEPQNWLTYYGAYDGQRFSALDQIDTGNVAKLRPAWVFQAGVIGLIAAPATYAFEATPLVVDGVMYMTGWDGYVWALDAVTGKLFWRYRQAVPLDVPLCCGNVNRGVAVAQGKVLFVSATGHLVALEATTGKMVWDTLFLDERAGESATLAPLVVKNLVLVGSSGGEYGTRGHIDAMDVATGKRVWRRYNVPKPGEPGSETWPKDNDSWSRGGGTAWVTGSYDPDLDLVYWATGNASALFDGADRPGANLYTDSILAFSPDDGHLRWHYQTTPHDVWDYDGVNEQILFEQEGRKLLAHFDRNGYFFVLDRTDGKLVRVAPFARTTWGEIDAGGKVSVKLMPTPEGTKICPSPAGGKEWPHAAYSPITKLLYTPVIEKCATFRRLPGEFRESMPYYKGDAVAEVDQGWGEVKAFDPATGKEVWSHKTEHPMVASMLATAGGLVFTGEPTGEFDAFDAKTGALLWKFQTGSGIHASPVTYSVGGKQYIAIPTGWGGWMKGFAPELYGGTRGSALMVFALP